MVMVPEPLTGEPSVQPDVGMRMVQSELELQDEMVIVLE